MVWPDKEASAYHRAIESTSSGTADTKRFSLGTQFLDHTAPNSGPFHLCLQHRRRTSCEKRKIKRSQKQRTEIIVCGLRHECIHISTNIVQTCPVRAHTHTGTGTGTTEHMHTLTTFSERNWTICNYARYRHLRIAFLHSITFRPLRKTRGIADFV